MTKTLPIESTILYNQIKKSVAWAKIYLLLDTQYHHKKPALTAKDVETISQFELSDAYAWKILDKLSTLKMVEKIGKKRNVFALKECLFIEKDKLIKLAQQTISKRGNKDEKE